MTEKEKVLISGDVEGRFKSFFSKIDIINKKNGPFEFLLCTGNFFGKKNSELEPYKNGTKTIPVPTFIIGPNNAEDVKNYPNGNGSELCTNLTYFGKHGVYTTSSGLKIAYLSGVEREDPNDSSGHLFGEKEVISVKDACLKGCPSFRGVDILLTAQWPEGMTNLVDETPNFEYKGSKLISWLVTHIKPRYHVVGLENIHYERQPYRYIPYYCNTIFLYYT